MANEYAVNQADLKAVADAIRTKGGTSDALVFPGGFVDAVGAIEAGSGDGIDLYKQLAERTLSGYHVDDIVENIGGGGFSNMNNLDGLRFKKAVTCSGESSIGGGAFKTVIFDKRIAFSGNYPFQNSYIERLVFKQGWSHTPNHFFYNAKKINALVLGGEFSSLPADMYLSSTVIGTGEGLIYVPSELVDTYKAATNWTAYADKIVAIEDYPGIEEF